MKFSCLSLALLLALCHLVLGANLSGAVKRVDIDAADIQPLAHDTIRKTPAQVSGRDINAVKTAALQKIQSDLKKLNKLTDEIVERAIKSEGNVFAIAKKKFAYADSVREGTDLDIKDIAQSAYDMATTMENGKGIKECITQFKRDALEQNEKAFPKDYVEPAEQRKNKAKEIDHHRISAWKEEHSKARYELGNARYRAEDELQKTKSELYVASIMAHFDRSVQHMAKVIKSIIPAMHQPHIQFGNYLDRRIQNLRLLSRHRVDALLRDVETCFRKTY